MAAEKKILKVFPIISLWKLLILWMGSVWTPRDLIGRIYVGYYLTINILYKLSEKKIFKGLSIVSLWKLLIPGAGPVWTRVARLAGFM